MTPARARAMLRAVASNAASHPLRPHQRTAITVFSFSELLTPGEVWFVTALRGLPSASETQWARLNQIAAKVERGRK